jgi:hypothetical protein
MCGIWRVGDEGEVHVAVGSDEGEGRRLRSGGGAVLDGEKELLAVTLQGKSGIDPCEEVRGAAQTLSAGGGAAVLAGVVDDDDGEVELPLELTEVAENGGNV